MNATGEDGINKQDLVEQASALFLTHVQDEIVIRHVEEMQNLLNMWQARTPVLIAAWLIVILKNDFVPELDLIDQFGTRAIQLAKQAIKHVFLDPKKDKRPSQMNDADHLRYLFAHTYADFEPVLITVAEHIATITQYDEMSDNDKQAWAQRNQAVYLPLLGLLGLWKHRNELGNITLYLLNPIEFERLDDQINLYKQRHQRLYEEIEPHLQQALQQHNIENATINLHITSPSALYNRIDKDGATIENASLIIDLVLEHEMECYLALGIIHSLWQPPTPRAHLPITEQADNNRFFDYIATPRFNGFRCLITTVANPPHTSDKPQTPQLIEFRIRTYQMAEVNRYGVTRALLSPTPIRNAWWNNDALRELVKPGSTDHFNQAAQIGVFTPRGDIIYPLPAGITMVDLIFKIHSQTAVYAKMFTVNGKTVSPSYTLHHRDLVAIDYDTHYPSIQPEWEDIAKLPATKAHIRRFFKRRDRAPQKGRRLIDDVLKRESTIYNMRFPEEKITAALTSIAKEYHYPSLDSLYVKVQSGGISPDEVVARMIEAELIGHIVLADGDEIENCRIRIAQTWQQEKESRKWDRNARVMPGVEIVGKYTGSGKTQTLTVYRRDAKQAPQGDQAVALRWRSAQGNQDAVEITITAPAQSHIIGMILNAVYSVGNEDNHHQIIIQRFNATHQATQILIEMVVAVPTPASLDALQEKLRVNQSSNYITDFKVLQLFPGQKLLITAKAGKQQSNPYTLKQVGNREMFYGRQEEIRRITSNIDEGHLVVLYGQKRIGKTSLLNQLSENLLLQSDHYLPILFDVHELAPFTTQSFLAGLIKAAQEKIRQIRPEHRKSLKFSEENLQREPFTAFSSWVKKVQQKLQGTQLIFLIDEFTRAEEECQRKNLDASFFDGLQWVIGFQNIGFVLCVHDHIMHREGNHSHGLLQRGQAIRLDALDTSSAMNLVQQPLGSRYQLAPDMVARILKLTNCHPYLIQVICHILITHMMQHDQDHIETHHIDSATREVIVHGDHYFSHLRNRANELDWDIVKIIAYSTDPDKEAWISSDKIRQALANFNYNIEGWQLSISLDSLRRANIIESQLINNQAHYRIPIGLFHLWVQQVVTHLIESPTAQRETQKD